MQIRIEKQYCLEFTQSFICNVIESSPFCFVLILFDGKIIGEKSTVGVVFSKILRLYLNIHSKKSSVESSFNTNTIILVIRRPLLDYESRNRPNVTWQTKADMESDLDCSLIRIYLF
jgi:hypothetical protein